MIIQLAEQLAITSKEADRYCFALRKIQKLVHTPTKSRYRSADQHFQADFDAIRRICTSALTSQNGGTDA